MLVLSVYWFSGLISLAVGCMLKLQRLGSTGWLCYIEAIKKVHTWGWFWIYVALLLLSILIVFQFTGNYFWRIYCSCWNTAPTMWFQQNSLSTVILQHYETRNHNDLSKVHFNETVYLIVNWIMCNCSKLYVAWRTTFSFTATLVSSR